MSSRLLNIALTQYGLKEVAGEENNPEIMKYFKEIGHTWVQNDETAWCSAFVNWCAKKAGKEYSGKLNARSWLKVGQEITDPVPGDIVILWREKKDSWKGHVGFFIRKNEEAVWILGGNQGIGQVNIKPYSLHRVLDYRRI